MSMSKEYLTYLDQHIDIAPANSQEEVDAADALEKAFSLKDIEVTREDIVTKYDPYLFYAIVMVLFFVSIIISGVGGLICTIVGASLSLIFALVLTLRFFGHDFISSILLKAKSQNVIAKHTGCGPHAGKGVRPVVILAHYDTGRKEMFASKTLSKYSKYLSISLPYATLVALICALLQLVIVIPELPLMIIWIVGLVCALVPLLWGANKIFAMFSHFVDSANDNNASLAALLSSLEDVAISDPELREKRHAEFAIVESQEAEEDDLLKVEDEFSAAVSEEPEVHGKPGTRHGKDALLEIGMLPSTCKIEYINGADVPRSIDSDGMQALETLASSSEATTALPAGAIDPHDEDTGIFSQQEIQQEMHQQAQQGISASSIPSFNEDTDPENLVQKSTAAPIVPEVPDNMWGTTEFKPDEVNKIARRAALFDLPDPTGDIADPFASTTWKGGATNSQERRDAGMDDADSMQDAIVDMDYVNLVAHDIWFVATGASQFDHAGIKQFIKDHKKELRGAYFINLENIGAGDLNLLTMEGYGNTRKYNRRMAKSLLNIAKDLHIPLVETKRNWTDTEATQLMRKSLRAITIMGCTPGAYPALAHSDLCTEQHIDIHQVADVARMITEFIRRA